MKPKNALEAKKGLLNDRSVKSYTRAKKSTPRSKKQGKSAISAPSVKRLKDKAWDLFSEYTRRRYASPNGMVECVTCGVWKKWQGDGMQAGHFIPGRSGALLFDERIVFPQCGYCNGPLLGNGFYYTRFMEQRLGSKEAVDALVLELKNKTIQRKAADYLELIEEYQLKLEGLK